MRKKSINQSAAEKKKQMQDSIFAGLEYIAKNGIEIQISQRELEDIIDRIPVPYVTRWQINAQGGDKIEKEAFDVVLSDDTKKPKCKISLKLTSA